MQLNDRTGSKRKKIEGRRSAPHIFLVNEKTGRLHRFRVLDKVEYADRKFIVLYPTSYPLILGENDSENVEKDIEDVVIFELGGIDTDRILSESIDDETFRKVFKAFIERNREVYKY